MSEQSMSLSAEKLGQICKSTMSSNKKTNRITLRTSVARTHSRNNNNALDDIKTPPRSAPGPARYSTSRLKLLATPRQYSSGKKPIESNFHRRHIKPECSNSGNSSWELVVSRNNRLTTGQKEIEKVLVNLHDRIQDQNRAWRKDLSPKINKLLYGISLSTNPTEDSEKCDHGIMSDTVQHKKTFLNQKDDDWDDCYSTAVDSNCDESLYHECSGDCGQTEISLHQKIEELTKLLASRDQSILVLTARLKEKDDNLEELRLLHKIESNVKCKTSSRVAESSNHFSIETNENDTKSRTSLDSTHSNQGSFNDFVVKLNEELDSQLAEIDQMKLDHEMQIDLIHDSFESELFTKEEQIAAMVTSLSSHDNQFDKEDKGFIDGSQVEMLVSSLETLKQEHESLRQALHLGNDAFHAALAENCTNIMNYIREELDAIHANGLRSYNETLEDELELTRWEIAELKAELQRMVDERRCDVAANETKRNDLSSTTPRLIVRTSPKTMFSPLPTFESWSHFCLRFREALAGNAKVGYPKKLVLDSTGKVKADMLLKELCFAREGTPHDMCGNEIFIDAMSESEC